METVPQLLKRHADLINYMYREEIVDSQFINILEMRALLDGQNFVRKTVALFREAADEKLEKAASELEKEEPNYAKIDRIIKDLRETSICIGTHGVISTCNSFITCYEAKNFEGCVKCFKRLEDEYLLIKSRLETLLQLEHQIEAAGVMIPVIERPINNMKRAFNPK